jgi:hypothetical protein
VRIVAAELGRVVDDVAGLNELDTDEKDAVLSKMHFRRVVVVPYLEIFVWVLSMNFGKKKAAILKKVG